LSHDLWDGCGNTAHPYGHGLIYCAADTRQLLSTLKLAPDFDDPTGQLDFVHRAVGTTDMYFVRNASNHAVDTTATFRIDGRAPELWNAIDGSITPQRAFTSESGRTRMPLHLAPFGSVFVVFTQPAGLHITQVLKDGQESPGVAIDGNESTGFHLQHAGAGTYQLKLSDGRQLTQHIGAPDVRNIPASQWTISFQPGRGAPANSQPLSAIQPRMKTAFQSWSESPLPGVKYFSGTATYRTKVDLPQTAGQHFILTLKDLHEICTVRVNGQNLGTIWAMPYRLDITAGLRNGSNTLELEVTNLWPNRIIGDAQPSATEKFTRTNIRKYTATSPLLPSGLVGSVTIEAIPVQH